jgi:hypothetical protein
VAANATSATSRATATSNGVPVQPLLLDGQRPPDVILDYTEFDTFLDIYLYRNKDALIGDLVERVIAPAEHKIEDILTRRSRFKDKLFGSSATRPSSSDA